ncbi:hypothetical protein [Acidicapsa acidisoli]|uniref:hypothetical protein n=1 Tax=Acidicapsa acidisoli TaxID=1615681 RepID=UPI0021DFC720|nr:hypothetical protein [Acidicapsa acidisoli]
MYKPVPRGEIADALIHLRELFRQRNPSNEREHLTHERREIVTKNLLSNLFRTKEHPTLHAVLELADIFSLTVDGAHRLFGYDLEEIREYDFRLNGGRTHIVESYPFGRDLLIDLPVRLGGREVFGWNAMLHDLVQEWQTDIPIRALEEEGWDRPGAFYVHVGTEDSLGSSLPPGAVALVESISEEEQQRPNPRAIYLLQYGNGYRCSRCVVTRGKLLLLVSARSYTGPQEFSYPGQVRIAGRIRVFALSLPLPEYPLLRSLPLSSQGAPLVLPWEHSSLDRLFAAKHLRFQRSRQDDPLVRKILEDVFHTTFSRRTERRYRSPTLSQPHVDTLIQLTVMNVARYTDSLRAKRSLTSDLGRFSLEALLNARHLADMPNRSPRAQFPTPGDIWEDRRKEFVEWPTLLSSKFPQLRSWSGKVIRLAQGNAIRGIEPSLSPGSLMVLDELSGIPDLEKEAKKTGWSRSLYALRRGADFLCGHLDKDGNQFALLSNPPSGGPPVLFGAEEFIQLSRVAGVAVPV